MRAVHWALVAAAHVAASASIASAAIAEYTFGPTSAPTVAAASAANASATDFTFGPNVTTLNQTGNNYSAPIWRTVARTTGSSADNSGFYVTFTASAAPGYELDLSSFKFDGAQGGGTANERRYAIYTSVDGLDMHPSNKSDIASGPDVKSGTFGMVRGGSNDKLVMPTFTADLSDARFQNLSSITIRVYFNTVDNGQNIDVDNFVLDGTVSAVPEPAAVGLLGAGGLLLRRVRATR